MKSDFCHVVSSQTDTSDPHHDERLQVSAPHTPGFLLPEPRPPSGMRCESLSGRPGAQSPAQTPEPLHGPSSSPHRYPPPEPTPTCCKVYWAVWVCQGTLGALLPSPGIEYNRRVNHVCSCSCKIIMSHFPSIPDSPEPDLMYRYHRGPGSLQVPKTPFTVLLSVFQAPTVCPCGVIPVVN